MSQTRPYMKDVDNSKFDEAKSSLNLDPEKLMLDHPLLRKLNLETVKELCNHCLLVRIK